ncbi:alkaline phosphatase [Endozoicomonas sp. SM1973]|uniref:Alkaline phosphatase n=1 Tax=Spartinivicinus marinus TaxID=2994442 RepID=A0A853I3M9_9GAMM|nr:alkaline phosphatase [Spartinivicinus marinus]MCX4027186.1 alkaline phosphatase [Spartinivicinus marinus]NYZ66092.1 alkaline phosphatase [Spartinivicinus marinus]
MKLTVKRIICKYLLSGWCFIPMITIAQPVISDNWFEAGQQAVAKAVHQQPNTSIARNVILFVGDGMGISTVTAARILDGQLKGKTGEENLLAFERLPYVGLSKTYNTNQQTADSAGTMTAMMTGVKTLAGVISVNQQVARGDCETAKRNKVMTLLEQAEQAEMATGIVTTARITHATPAATYAHSPERGWEDDDDMPSSAKRAGCKDIARQLIEFPYGNGLEVALGGGRRSFLPDNQVDPEEPNKTGAREDGRNLTVEWLTKYNNAQYVWNEQQFMSIKAANVDHLLGLFNRSHMAFEADRNDDKGGEPSLSEMTAKAIEILQKNENGFFLMVEGGRIDHGHHAGNAYRALHDTIEFSKAVATAIKMTDARETLVIVTADHSHVFTMGGYPTRGNPILGKVVGNNSKGQPNKSPTLAADGLPYTTLGYYSGQGAANDQSGQRQPGRMNIVNVNTKSKNYFQEVLLPMSSETHGGEDVAIYASGPWAHLFHGVHEQNYIYHVMAHAAKLNDQQTAQQQQSR